MKEHPLCCLVWLLRWPEKPGNNYAPWFVIAWRALFTPLVYVGMSIAWVGIALSRGMRDAARFWRDAS